MVEVFLGRERGPAKGGLRYQLSNKGGRNKGNRKKISYGKEGLGFSTMTFSRKNPVQSRIGRS